MIPRVLVVIFAACLLGGCSRSPRIRSGEVSVMGTKDAGKPATLDTSSEGEVLEIPAGSEVTVTEYEAVAAKPATNDTPAVEAEPAKKVTEVKLSGTSNWRRNKATVKADTGTVDTTVAKHRIDAQERRWLLWAAIGCGLAGLVVRSMLPAWPALSNGLLIASPVAFAAWKLAEVPPWLWGVVVSGVVLMALGYKRAEWDANGDGIPDVFQRAKQPNKKRNPES